jgi:hypothetical protein
MDHPLYGAALFLNPGKFHPIVAANDDAAVGDLRGSFLDVLGRMVEDEETRKKIDAQATDYEKLRGPAFSNKMAIQNLESMNPSKCYVYLSMFLLISANKFCSQLLIIAYNCYSS